MWLCIYIYIHTYICYIYIYIYSNRRHIFITYVNKNCWTGILSRARSPGGLLLWPNLSRLMAIIFRTRFFWRCWMSHVELKALKAPIFGEAPVLCGSNMSKHVKTMETDYSWPKWVQIWRANAHPPSSIGHIGMDPSPYSYEYLPMNTNDIWDEIWWWPSLTNQ